MLETYFDILNPLGVIHECNKQTDGKMDTVRISCQMPRSTTLLG